VNAELNLVKGKGYEHTTLQYRMAKLSFAGIENIHVVRSSLRAFLNALQHQYASLSQTCALPPRSLPDLPPPKPEIPTQPHRHATASKV
jgi:hypothetical protein